MKFNLFRHILDPLGFFLRTAMPFVWRIVSAVPTRLNPLAEGVCSSQVRRVPQGDRRDGDAAAVRRRGAVRDRRRLVRR